jgi:hypothetical protein
MYLEAGLGSAGGPIKTKESHYGFGILQEHFTVLFLIVIKEWLFLDKNLWT